MDGKLSKQASGHAYLILCHNNFEQLCLLLELLDDERNDIYIHVDKKVKDAPFDMLKSAVKHSDIRFVKRVSVTWGGYSLIQAEMELFKAAASGDYAYCHLISGVDLPLKSQDEIHAFFNALGEKQCITYDPIENCLDRLQYYYFLQEIIGRKRDLIIKLLRRVQRLILWLQRVLGVNRIKGREAEFYKGTNWVSVTGAFAKFLTENEALIRKQYGFTRTADEIFIQTLAMKSPFRDSLYTHGVHYIDWERGEPYTFTAEDFELLINSGKPFARKFDCRQDSEIIQRIYNHVKNIEQRS